MIFTRRLAGLPAHVFFAAFAVLVLLMVENPVREQNVLYAVLVLLAVAFIGVGTFGWQSVQRRGEPHLVYGYFTVQTGLLVVMITLERPYAGFNVTTGMLALLLIVQASVFSARRHFLAYVLLAALVVFFFMIGQPPDQLISVGAGVVFFLFMAYLLATLVIREERALQTNRKLALYAAEAEELATLRERNRLAREIHDNLGHYLTAVNMQIEAALAVLDTQPEKSRETLLKAQSLTKEGLGEIRRSIHALRANARPLHEAIQLLVDEHRATGCSIDYRVEGEKRACSPVVESTLYRVAQEGLTNIRKHAPDAPAELVLRYNHTVCLRIHNDGVGSAKVDGGFGLIGLQERVQALDGRLTINTAQGFTLEVEITP